MCQGLMGQGLMGQGLICPGSGCSAKTDIERPRAVPIRRVYPPRDSTTLRQGSESFVLLSRRQAFICGGLPMCSAQNFPASERQAICSCGLGPDCAGASVLPASSMMSAVRADAIFFMGGHLIKAEWDSSARNLVEAAVAVHAMFMAAKSAAQRRRTIFMGC